MVEQPVEKVYQKKTQMEHILLRPDTYIGSIDHTDPQKMWVLSKNQDRFEEKEIRYVPGLYKIFDEIIVNAADNIHRDKHTTIIKVNINQAKNTISVYNNGKGIPVEMHKEHQCYVPELVFGHLLTSSNYDDKQEKVTGGRNGFGAKLTNIFSKKFTVETSDSKKKKKYVQVFEKNMSVVGKPVITPLEGDEDDYTLITFEPDLKKFRMSGLDDDIASLLRKRVWDLAGCTSASVYLDNKKIKDINNFENYVDRYFIDKYGAKQEVEKFYEKINRWEICIAVVPDQYQFQQMSFVNSICTTRGGTHVSHVTDQICNYMVEVINKKEKKLEIKVPQVKQHLWAFINCQIVNPAFDSQTKETLTTKPNAFGSQCKLSESFYKKLQKSSLIDSIISSAQAREQAKLQRSLGTKTKKEKLYGIPKLEDANWAGTKRSLECTLILTEGDSAKSLAMSGIQVVGRDKYGVFPLKGKLLNVRDVSIKQMSENDEVQNMMKIMGLQMNKSYDHRDDLHSLRYGSIMIMTDQDHDGSHIKGLLINFLHQYWPSLLHKHRNFLKEFITPIIKVTKKDVKIPFFTIPEYEKWAEDTQNKKSYQIKYYKGLGTSTSAEAKEYFKVIEKHRINFEYKNQDDDEAIDLAFNKRKADMRKEWLSNYNPKTFVDHSARELRYLDFVNKELIHFSNADNLRSIPSLIDGFKPGQRKILFACFKRKLKNELKVAQLAGYVAEHSAYHHGEISLCQTIIGMAQDYVGSNNINFLLPIGQFGTRALGGKDAASSRYIFTNLSPLVRSIFNIDDDHILNFQNEEGQSIEPVFYMPIIPMVLVNGAEGIGTGWSTSVPCYNPLEICDNIKRKLRGEEFFRMRPWYQGFKGTFNEKDDSLTSYVVCGKWQRNGDILTIKELPIGAWTRNYKTFLEDLAIKNQIDDIRESHTDNTVCFELSVPNLKKMSEEEVEKTFKLSASLSCNNFVLFDKNHCLKRYENELSILDEYFEHRLDMYGERKKSKLKRLDQAVRLIENKHRFIDDIINGRLKVLGKKRAEIIQTLQETGFEKYEEIYPGQIEKMENGADNDKSEKKKDKNKFDVTAHEQLKEHKESPRKLLSEYNYLLNLKILTFSNEKLESLREDMSRAQQQLKQLQKSTPADLWLEDIAEFEEAYKKLFKIEAYVPPKQQQIARFTRPKQEPQDGTMSEQQKGSQITPKNPTPLQVATQTKAPTPIAPSRRAPVDRSRSPTPVPDPKKAQAKAKVKEEASEQKKAATSNGKSKKASAFINDEVEYDEEIPSQELEDALSSEEEVIRKHATSSRRGKLVRQDNESTSNSKTQVPTQRDLSPKPVKKEQVKVTPQAKVKTAAKAPTPMTGKSGKSDSTIGQKRKTNASRKIEDSEDSDSLYDSDSEQEVINKYVSSTRGVPVPPQQLKRKESSQSSISSELSFQQREDEPTKPVKKEIQKGSPKKFKTEEEKEPQSGLTAKEEKPQADGYSSVMKLPITPSGSRLLEAFNNHNTSTSLPVKQTLTSSTAVIGTMAGVQEHDLSLAQRLAQKSTSATTVAALMKVTEGGENKTFVSPFKNGKQSTLSFGDEKQLLAKIEKSTKDLKEEDDALQIRQKKKKVLIEDDDE